MAKRNSNADRRLRKMKIAHQEQLRRLKNEFGEQLAGVEQALQPLLYSQCFYHEALMNLLTSENEPDSDTLIGAMIVQRWIRTTGQQLQQRIMDYRAQQRT
jgi:hypothetical protein